MTATWIKSVVAACCIGVACALLQPKQPRSMAATVLLITAWWCTQ